MLDQDIQIDAGRLYSRKFIRRALCVLLILLPLALVCNLAATMVHEVLGHGGVTLTLGGQLNGFDLHPSATGHAWTTFPPGSPTWKYIAMLAGGSGVSFLVGLVLLLLGARTRRPIPSLVLLVQSFALLLDGPAYYFWSSIAQDGSGDAARIIQLAQTPAIRPILIAVSALLALAATWCLTALLFRNLERWLGREGRLAGGYRLIVLAVLGLLPAAMWFPTDWSEIGVDMGLLPNIVGASMHVLCAGSLWWVRYCPRASCPSRRAAGVAMGGTWAVAVALFAVTWLWLQHGVGVGKKIEIPPVVIARVDASFTGNRIVIGGMRISGDKNITRFVRVVSVDGIVVADVQNSLQAACSPDGATLAYERFSAKAPFELWRMRLADGTRTLVDSAVLPGGEPLFSPDGRQLAVVRKTGELGEGTFLRRAGELTTIDLATGRRQIIAKDVDAWGGHCWTRDGRTIFFLRRFYSESGDTVGEGIFQRGLDDSPERRLLDCKPEDGSPYRLTPSPDGKSLGFERRHKFCILDLSTGRVAEAFEIYTSSRFYDWGKSGICHIQADSAPDGTVLAVYDPATGQTVQFPQPAQLRGVGWLDQEHVLTWDQTNVALFDVRTKERREVVTLAK